MSIECDEDRNSPGRFLGRCTGTSARTVNDVASMLQKVSDYFAGLGKPVRLEYLTLDHPIQQGDQYQIFFDYYELDAESATGQRVPMRLSVTCTMVGSPALARIEVSVGGDNVSGLVKSAIQSLGRYEGWVVEDIILHDRINESGVHDPLLRIYMLSSSG